VRHLDVVAAATDSYVANLDTSKNDESARKNRYHDWQTLHSDLVHYRALVVPNEEDERGQAEWLKARSAGEKSRKELKLKRDTLLTQNGFKNRLDERDENDYRALDFGESYDNDYMRVSFRNLNIWRDGTQNYLLLDHYEERL
jgi:hypothetical protein